MGVSSHKSKKLQVLKNIALVLLPSYSSELNPAEQIWNMFRRDYFANKVFDSVAAAILQAEKGLANIASDGEGLKRLTNWPWINAIVTAN